MTLPSDNQSKEEKKKRFGKEDIIMSIAFVGISLSIILFMYLRYGLSQ